MATAPLFLCSWLAVGIVPAYAQPSSSPAPAAGETGAAARSAPSAGALHAEPDSEAAQTEAFRHSSTVQSIARVLHMPVETAATTFEFLNFGILAVSVLYFIFKLVPKMFRGRQEGIAAQLVEARTATEQANQRLGGVEARLARLDDEIAAIRMQVEQDAAQDEIRMKAALEEGKKRITEAAGHEVEAAGTAAQRELRRFAAELAVERATHSFSLTAEMDRLLLSDFGREIVGDASKADGLGRGRN